MWENEGRKNLIRNIVVFLLLIVAAAGLLFAMLSVKKRIAAEDAVLKEASSSQQQELSEARQENLEAIDVAYKRDMETVNTYLPGIVCWGDSLTAGSSGNISYPSTLQKYLDTYLCSIYDFRSTIDNAQEYSRLDWENYTVSIPVVNMGSGQEDSATILGRSGVVPYVLADGFEIPANTEGVAITIESEDGKTVNPLTAGNTGVNPVTIAGVEGTITRTASGQNWGKTTYLFTRTEAGEPVSWKRGRRSSLPAPTSIRIICTLCGWVHTAITPPRKSWSATPRHCWHIRWAAAVVTWFLALVPFGAAGTMLTPLP